MCNKLVFVVERKSGKMPDVTWVKVFEREIDITLCYQSVSDLIESLHCLYQGDNFRVVVYA